MDSAGSVRIVQSNSFPGPAWGPPGQGYAPAGPGELVFSTPGIVNWPVPDGINHVRIQCWGGGAGGSAPPNDTVGGGGGGAGEYSVGYIESPGLKSGATMKIQVGAGGVGQIALPGKVGGDSQVEITGSGYIYASRGNGGGIDGSGGTGGNGGDAGAPFVMTSSTPGANGQTAPDKTLGGSGGDCANGGAGGAGSASKVGNAGEYPGGGGGGVTYDAAAVGAAGGAGKVVLSWGPDVS